MLGSLIVGTPVAPAWRTGLPGGTTLRRGRQAQAAPLSRQGPRPCVYSMYDPAPGQQRGRAPLEPSNRLGARHNGPPPSHSLLRTPSSARAAPCAPVIRARKRVYYQQCLLFFLFPVYFMRLACFCWLASNPRPPHLYPARPLIVQARPSSLGQTPAICVLPVPSNPRSVEVACAWTH